jgi:lipopolysaccharide/colanic/teichoic acid biosynthesis glycosyltransferase
MSVQASDDPTANPSSLQEHARFLDEILQRKSKYLSLRRSCEIFILILVTLPALLVVTLAAIAIYFMMGAPVFFLQDRIGLGGNIFRMVKLRTMTQKPSRQIGATSTDDPRITPLGHLLRKSHIDELPQLWNIWRGDMGLVGPRPEQPHLANLYRDVIPNYSLRHMVRPGLTGYAQVYFGYATNLAETRLKLEYDLYYIRHLGPVLDLRILVHTFAILISQKQLSLSL